MGLKKALEVMLESMADRTGPPTGTDLLVGSSRTSPGWSATSASASSRRMYGEEERDCDLYESRRCRRPSSMLHQDDGSPRRDGCSRTSRPRACRSLPPDEPSGTRTSGESVMRRDFILGGSASDRRGQGPSDVMRHRQLRAARNVRMQDVLAATSDCSYSFTALPSARAARRSPACRRTAGRSRR